MVHVVTPRPSIGSALGNALGALGSQQLNQFQQKQRQNEQRSLLQKGLTEAQSIYANPNLTPQQKQIGLLQAFGDFPELGFKLNQSLTQLPTQEDQLEDQRNFEIIKNNFGENAANLYKAAPTGGKTAILERLLEMKQRGEKLEDLIENESPEISEKSPRKSIDFDKGLTSKERVSRQEARYKTNLPLQQESSKKLSGLSAEKDALDILEDLSPKISSLHRLNISPGTGELIIPALASPEAQRFVKTINDFTTKAKDTYGARVTNFELDRFLKRLPTLANSEIGRRQIIDQMKIINEINTAKEKELQDIIEEAGGIRNIDWDKAERLSDKRSKKDTDNLRKKFKEIDKNLDNEEKNEFNQIKKITPKGHKAIITPEGQTGFIPDGQVSDFLKNNPGSELL